MVHSLKDTVIGHLDIILAVHYIISQVVSSGCLSRGTFFAQMELMVWCGREVGWWWQCQGEQREGKGRVENGFQFWTHHIWVIILHVVEPCPPLPQTPLVQTRKKNQINKEKSPKKKKNTEKKNRNRKKPKLALRSAGKVCDMEKQALLRRPMVSYQNLMKKWAKRVPDSQRQASALEAEFTPSMTAPGPV